jgi:DNA polymerase-3 subunit epsilon
VILFFDTETTGLPDYSFPLSDPRHPHIVTIAAVGFTPERKEIASYYAIIKPDGWIIPPGAAKVHGITTEFAMEHGLPANEVLWSFLSLWRKADLKIAFNKSFDNWMIDHELYHALSEHRHVFDISRTRCAMLAASACMKEPNPWPGYEHEYRWPKLKEAYQWLYKQPMPDAHHAMGDTRNTAHFSFDLQAQKFWDWETDRAM